MIDTPISETAFVGAGIGAATESMRPIVELMFVDFFGVCMDQIYNHMAKIHYESGGNVKVPMVLMTFAGGWHSDAAQHSQCLWGTFAHLPGMKVVVPSNPADAKGLMISAIRDDNPVVYIGHKMILGLPWTARNPRSTAPVPKEPYEVPIGEAAVRKGKDATIVTLGFSVHHALDIAEELAEEGIDLEVIDLRSLVPLDRKAVLGSVAKTGKLMVVDEDYRSFGLSGEISATIAEEDPALLRAPLARVAVPDLPLPYSETARVRCPPDARSHRGGRAEAGGYVSEVRFPALKEDEPDAEGLLATWFVGDGDAVEEGQLLCEVQVEKTSADIEATSAGTIRFEAAEGDVVRQGTVIATIE